MDKLSVKVLLVIIYICLNMYAANILIFFINRS
jgi:hypothetical protein